MYEVNIKKLCRSFFILILKKTFLIWQKIGIHISPVHYNEPIPDTRSLSENLWQNHSELIGINLTEDKQMELLSIFVSNYKNEYDQFPKEKSSIPYEYYINNGTFGSVDGEILYSMVRYFKPNNIIEVGSGNSTYLSAQAIMKNSSDDENYKCNLIAIEPFPNNILKEGFPGLSKCIQKKVQEIDLIEFNKLQENDILFIDSSHMLKIGSDVQYVYLELLPRLNKGVIIQIHDIFFPMEYPKSWILKDFVFWNEQYLLQAFLSFNESYQILWSSSYIHIKYPHLLRSSFSSYNEERLMPGSIWLKKIK